jgi:hypothetical protein
MTIGSQFQLQVHHIQTNFILHNLGDLYEFWPAKGTADDRQHPIFYHPRSGVWRVAPLTDSSSYLCISKL